MSSQAVLTKPVLPPLQTPKSANFPSEIVSTPMSACHPLSAFIKQEQDMKTPITPPTAYTDFLKALTPILNSPPPCVLGRSQSDDAVLMNRESVSSACSKTSFGGERYLSPTSIPTPHSAPGNSGRGTPTSLKRLRIPQYSPVFSPTSASHNALYSPYSPAEWVGRTNFESIATPRSASAKPVSVRSVVTRTVTYKRTTPSLEPAPKGKRRRVGSSTSSITSKEATPEPTKSKLDRIDEAAKENLSPDTKLEESQSSPVVMAPPSAPSINISPAASVDGSETEGSDIPTPESSNNSTSP